MSLAPAYLHDFYGDAFLADPYHHYKCMRDLAPVVELPLNEGYAITRYADVRHALRDNRLFISGRGIMMNKPSNDMFAGHSALNMDGSQHAERRKVIAKPLMPGAIAPLREEIEAIANGLVDELVGQRSFDGVEEFANIIPITLVSRIVGLPEEGRQRMLHWAGAIFDIMGNINHRYHAALPAQKEAMDYIAALKPEELAPGSWGARAFALAASGEITDRQAREVVMSYVGPALDTTISATAGALLLFGENPDQWALVRADPSRIPAALEEAMRLETPIRAFSRVASAEANVDGVLLPEGARVLLVYASANRDERRWENPERFDVLRRAPQEQLAFGTGVHMCPGMHLARLEMRCLFEAFAKRVISFQIGRVHRSPKQLLRGLESFEVNISRAA